MKRLLSILKDESGYQPFYLMIFAIFGIIVAVSLPYVIDGNWRQGIINVIMVVAIAAGLFLLQRVADLIDRVANKRGQKKE